MQRRAVAMHAETLEQKAHIDTETVAKNVTDHVDKIQKFLDSNMDVDLMDIRRKQDLLLSSLDDYQSELDDKTSVEQGRTQ